MAALAEVRDLLVEAGSLPHHLVDVLLQDASPWWVQDERAEVLAGDLALCHPPLRANEARVMVRGSNCPAIWRVTVVAQDGTSLLADVVAALEAEGFLIIKVVVGACEDEHERAVVVARVLGPLGLAQPAWDRVSTTITKAATGAAVPDVAFAPRRPLRVAVHAQGGRCQLVVLEAPQQAGLLSTLASWLAEGGCDVEALWFDARGSGRALALVRGELDAGDLATFLAGPSRAFLWLRVLGTLITEARELLGRAPTLPSPSQHSAKSPRARRCIALQPLEPQPYQLPLRKSRHSATRLGHHERPEFPRPPGRPKVRHRVTRAS